MKIGIDMGHTLSGVGTGAVGVVKETDKNRLAGKRLIDMLKAKNHTVFDCTVDVSTNDLVDRVSLANKQSLDLFVSIHLNASNGQGHGVETYVYTTSSKAYPYAEAIQSELVKEIGWANRGVKTASFYVIRKTSSPALLVELGFCDNISDMNKWDTEKICRALFKGITGQSYDGAVSDNTPEIEESKPVTNTVYEKAKSYNASRCKELQEKLNKCGYNAGTVDGIYGPNTHKALGEFQSKNGLVVDYLAGNATFAKLDDLIAKAQSASNVDPWVKKLQEACNAQGYKKQVVDGIAGPNTLAACPLLKVGSKEKAIIKLLQERLVSLGYSTNGVDGIFGNGTLTAVKQYQSRKALIVDGIVGNGTWTKLLFKA